MSTLRDNEFGTIAIRRSSRTRKISVRLSPDGSLKATLPVYTPVFLLKKLINDSRDELRKLTGSNDDSIEFTDGMSLGKSHRLVVIERDSSLPTKVERAERNLVVYLSKNDTISQAQVKNLIKKEYKKLLQIEARAYLPRRLEGFAATHGFTYERVRFSHATSRWGSCSSSGTISLNIALMKLPHELIDYVLIHELCHTVEMNHSKTFWQLVERCHPDYKLHRGQIKQYNPYL